MLKSKMVHVALIVNKAWGETIPKFLKGMDIYNVSFLNTADQTNLKPCYSITIYSHTISYNIL